MAKLVDLNSWFSSKFIKNDERRLTMKIKWSLVDDELHSRSGEHYSNIDSFSVARAYLRVFGIRQDNATHVAFLYRSFEVRLET